MKYYLLNPIFVFYFLLLTMILYIYVAQKTKLFKNNLNFLGYSIQITLNFNYYILMLYIFSFFFITLILFLNMGFNLLADVYVYTAQEIAKEIMPDIENTNKSIEHTNIEKNNNSIQNTNQTNKMKVFSPNEHVPKNTPSFFQQMKSFFKQPLRITSDYFAIEKALKVASQPTKSSESIEMVSQLLKAGSSAHHTNVGDGPYTPQELRLPADVVPSGSSLATGSYHEINGERKFVFCYKLNDSIEVYEKIVDATTGKPTFTFFEKLAIKTASFCSDGSTTRCVVFPDKQGIQQTAIEDSLPENLKQYHLGTSPKSHFPNHSVTDV